MTLEINELSAITYMRFVNPEYDTGYEDDGRIFVKGLPSHKPIEPGSNRPMISKSPFAPPKDTIHYEVLNKVSKQGFRVSRAFMDLMGATFPKNCTERGNWLDTIERTFLGLWRKKGEILYTDAFYDWRGRVYDMSGEWGSLQNNKLSRAALSAPERYAVTEEGFHYLKKLFFHEGWPTTPEDAQEYLENPQFDGNGAIDWMGARAALTILEIHKTGMTNYLVEQDASCSGFQHMALLMRDLRLAEIVNAVFSHIHGDLYLMVAEEGKIAEYLFDGDLRKARKFAKTIVMLTGYGSGASGIASSYWLDAGGEGELDEEEGLFLADEDTTIFIGTKEFTYENLKGFVKEQQEILFKKFPSIQVLRTECIKYYVECINADPESFIWTTPDGFIAHRVITLDEQECNRVGAAGAMPNLIHSLYAAIVRYVIRNWNRTLGVVHDAFFTTINDALELRELVREAYRYIHTNLGEFPVKREGTLPEIGKCIGI